MIQLFNFNHEKLYKLNIMGLYDNKIDMKETKKLDLFFYGSAVNYLSKPFWDTTQYSINTNNKTEYVMISRIGGRTDIETITDECDCIVFDAKYLYGNASSLKDTIDCFYMKLPTLFEPRYLSTTIAYNNNYIINVGGYNTSIQSCNEISMLDLNKSKWKILNKMNTNRYITSLCFYDNDNLMIMGGKARKSKFLKSCELYNINTNKMINISDMNIERSKAGSLSIKELNKIIIAGGLGTVNTSMDKTNKISELYDINKNAWHYINKKTKYFYEYPCILNDYNNYNIIYIVGNDGYGNLDLGNIEYCDLRSNNPNWDTYKFRNYDNNNPNSLSKIFNLNDNNPTNWIRREFLCLSS